MITFGSLFAGIGGVDLGLERAGMQCAWQVEIDDYATKVLAKHWPDVARFRDIRDCGAHNLAPVDLIAGGFPCQDISYAGRGAGLAGARSGLWYEYARIVRELRPRYVLVENVSALLTRGLDAVLGTLASLGYDAEWHCIPAAYVGAPHRRDRVYIVAHASRARRWQNARGAYGYESQDAGRRAPHNYESTGHGQGDRAGQVSAPMADANEPRLAFGQSITGHDGAQRAPAERGSWWAVEPDVGRVAHGIPARVERLRGLGNAVVPQVAELIGRAIVARDAMM